MRHRITRAAATALTTLAVLALPAPAPATPTDPCTTSVEWAQQVVTSTELPPPAGWTVVYECEAHDRLLGYADRASRTVTIWAGSTDRPSWLAWTYVHEVAHAYDLTLMTPDDRMLWRGVRGISDEPEWWGERGLPPEEWAALPSEDFAEAFAACWLGELPAGWPWRVVHAGAPGEAECQIMLHLVSVPAERG